MTKDEALKMAIAEIEGWLDHAYGHSPEECADNKAIQACKEALEQEERTQRTMHCGTADAFIAMDDDHKRRWFVQSLRESKRRKELEDILEQPAQEPVAFTNVDELSELKSGMTTCYMYKEAIDKDDIALYTHPAPSWQGLSDDEIYRIYGEVQDNCVKDFPSELYAAWFKNTKEKNAWNSY